VKEKLAETIIEHIEGIAASQTADAAEQVAPAPEAAASPDLQAEAAAKANL